MTPIGRARRRIPAPPQRVLFLCTHNSARSQIAEALLNARFPDRYWAQSAGTDPSRVHPAAIRVLAEIGIDASKQTSKHLSEFLGAPFDWVVTVCDDADRVCPVFPGGRRRVHRGFADPSRGPGTDDEILARFRRIRDEIDAWIEETFAPDPSDSDAESSGNAGDLA